MGLVLEYAPLGAVSDHFHALPKAQLTVFKLFSGIVSGLAHMHRLDLVHRDIKADNVLIFEGNVAKLCDFGFTARVGDVSMHGCGTVPYMAPEIIADVCSSLALLCFGCAHE